MVLKRCVQHFLNKEIGMLFVRVLILSVVAISLLASCGGTRCPNQMSLAQMSVRDMFPGDLQAQALALAAARGDTVEMDSLVASGANPNAIGTHGVTVPAWVLYHPNRAGFRHLLELGADPNKIWKSNDGNDSSLIHWTVTMTHKIGIGYLQDVINVGNGDMYLRAGRVMETPVDISVAPWLEGALGVFIEKGLDVNYKGYKARIPLVMLTSRARNYRATLFLLASGVDYKATTEDGDSLVAHMQRMLNFGYEVASRPRFPEYMSFWRCIDYLEKQGESFVVTEKAKRPLTLDAEPPSIFSGLNSCEP